MDAVDITLSAPAKVKRFKLVNELPLSNGAGVVGAGRTTKNRRDGSSDPTLYLVEDTGAQAAVSMHAVATAVAGGIISIPSLVAAFKATGALDALTAEVAKQTPAPAKAPGK